MKKIIIVLAGALLLSCASQQAYYATSTVNVSGYGSVEVEPDYMTVFFSVETEAVDPSRSQAQNARLSEQAITFLKNSGIDEKWVATLNYNLQETTEYNYETERYEKSGYLTSHSLQVRIADLDMLPDILSGLLKTGVTRIDSMDYGMDNLLDIQHEALRRAVSEARVKAETMVSDENVTIGKVLSLNAQDYSSPSLGPVMVQNLMAADQRGGGGDSISTGTRFVRANVSVTFELVSE